MPVEVDVHLTLHENTETVDQRYIVTQRLRKFLKTGETFDQLKIEVVK